MDVLNLGEELDHTVYSSQGDQEQADKVQKREDPEAHKPTQDFWITPDEEPQMFVPQTKQKTQPSCQPPSVRQYQLNKVRYRNRSRI